MLVQVFRFCVSNFPLTLCLVGNLGHHSTGMAPFPGSGTSSAGESFLKGPGAPAPSHTILQMLSKGQQSSKPTLRIRECVFSSQSFGDTKRGTQPLPNTGMWDGGWVRRTVLRHLYPRTSCHLFSHYWIFLREETDLGVGSELSYNWEHTLPSGAMAEQCGVLLACSFFLVWHFLLSHASSPHIFLPFAVMCSTLHLHFSVASLFLIMLRKTPLPLGGCCSHNVFPVHSSCHICAALLHSEPLLPFRLATSYL